MYKLCEKCKGLKEVMGIGHFMTPCDVCAGSGKVEVDDPVDLPVEDDVEHAVADDNVSRETLTLVEAKVDKRTKAYKEQVGA